MNNQSASANLNFDWVVIGSGFGGSVSALRLAEKGYRVAVLERGRRYSPHDLPKSAWQAGRFIWAPKLGLHGIMRMSVFRHIFFPSQSAVGGGSVVYGGVLLRAKSAFFDADQWRDLEDWKGVFAKHYATAERMLGVGKVPFDSQNEKWVREMGRLFGAEQKVHQAPTGVFFGEPGQTVPDPYFGGDGPDRTGCIRCGECMVGCRTGSVNSLTQNYLWFAEKRGVDIVANRQVVDVRPVGAADGSDGYQVTSERPGAWFRRDRQTITARGVIFAGGALGTNELLATCKHGGSLPAISDQLESWFGQIASPSSPSCSPKTNKAGAM